MYVVHFYDKVNHRIVGVFSSLQQVERGIQTYIKSYQQHVISDTKRALQRLERQLALDITNDERQTLSRQSSELQQQLQSMLADTFDFFGNDRNEVKTRQLFWVQACVLDQAQPFRF